MKKINMRSLRGSLLLITATVIWGNAFVAQTVGMESMGPFTFQAIRCMLAVLFLFPVSMILEMPKKGASAYFKTWTDPLLWKAGIICGLALFAAASLQQVGLVDNDSTGKAGFITAMYIVIVPFLGLFIHKRPGFNAYIGVVLALIGLYLLCCAGVSDINKKDLLLLGCAFFFSVQILLVDHFAPDLSGIQLNCIQALVTSVLSMGFMFTSENPDIRVILPSWFPLCFAGILSMGAAYTLQIEGQKLVEPTAASLLMSTESVFAALGGWLILQQHMHLVQILGSCLVFSGIIMSQLPIKLSGTKKHRADKKPFSGSGDPI